MTEVAMDVAYRPQALDRASQELLGKPIDRWEGPAKVSGAALYAYEGAPEGTAHAAVIASTIGCGRVVSIDIAAAKAMPGVLAIITDDPHLPSGNSNGKSPALRGPTDQIDQFGQPLGVVVAITLEAARAAADAVVVDYEAREGRYDPRAVPVEHDHGIGFLPKIDKGDLDAALAAADVVFDRTYTTPPHFPAAMEPHATTASWDGDMLTVTSSLQMMASSRETIAASLGIGEDKVRVLGRFVGGGFGGKTGVGPEVIMAAIGARETGRPVKVALPRRQTAYLVHHRGDTMQRVRIGCDKQGRISAIGHESISSQKEDRNFLEPVPFGTLPLYAGENRRFTTALTRVDLPSSGAVRAPGEAVGTLAIETAMDELAEMLGLDPIELRRRNEPESDPLSGKPFSTRLMLACYDEGARRFGWDRRNATPGATRDGEWLIGIGMAAALRGNFTVASEARVRLEENGTATIETDMTDIGTGTYTILAQIAGEMLGLPMNRIDVVIGDSDLPKSAGSGGSFGAGSAGSAVALACEDILAELALRMNASTDELLLKDGTVTAGGRQVPITDLLRGEAIEGYGTMKPGKASRSTSQASHGAQFAEVAVSAVTGEVRVRRLIGVFDVGRVLNEKTARGQMTGGMIWGIGYALSEDAIVDTRTGHFVNPDFGEYHVAVNADAPQVECHFIEEIDDIANPVGAKAVGELGISGAGAAVVNAIYNACGVRVYDFPVTLDKLLPGLPTYDGEQQRSSGGAQEQADERWPITIPCLPPPPHGRGAPMAIATVVSTWGSAPRPKGSHMIVHGDGRFEGSVSGGCVESDILATAAEVIAGAPFVIKNYGVEDAAAWEVGLPCGGEIAVMVQPVSAAGFDPELFDRIAEARDAGQALSVSTDLDSGQSSLRTAPGAAFVNRYDPPRRLLIVGAVQIAQALSGLARELGIDTVIIDPRARFLTAERFPGVTLDDRWPDEAIAAYAPGPSTAVVTLSHDTKIDDPALIAALQRNTAYVGALGSRRSHAARRERLAVAGVAAADLDRIDAPVGLDIGAIGPAEIALSIAAAMIGAFHAPGQEARA